MTKQHHIWLRAETKPLEQRTALTPLHAKALQDLGVQVSIESSQQNIFSDKEYSELGLNVVPQGTWRDAPKDAYILGLKELEENSFPLTHKHIYFAHAYKEQQGWQSILSRFTKGKGTLFDLEYLTDESGRRIAAFGYWAGYAGAALAIQAWCNQKLNKTHRAISSFANKELLLDQLQTVLAQINERPTVMVIGAKGRSGSGASQLAKDLGLSTTEWDIEETKVGGPFKAINDHHIFVNCVLVNKDLPPFVNTASLSDENRTLSVIADVSCDPYGSYNPLPVYSSCTTFDSPCIKVEAAGPKLELIAIDHLPSLLPKESSEDYGEQLFPHIASLASEATVVWHNALQHFKLHTSKL